MKYTRTYWSAIPHASARDPGIRTLYKKQRTAQLSKVQYFVFSTAACFYWYLLVRTSYHNRSQQCKIIIIIIQLCVYMCACACVCTCVCVVCVCVCVSADNVVCAHEEETVLCYIYRHIDIIPYVL